MPAGAAVFSDAATADFTDPECSVSDAAACHLLLQDLAWVPASDAALVSDLVLVSDLAQALVPVQADAEVPADLADPDVSSRLYAFRIPLGIRFFRAQKNRENFPAYSEYSLARSMTDSLLVITPSTPQSRYFWAAARESTVHTHSSLPES